VCMKENPYCRYVIKRSHEDSLNMLSGGEDCEESMD